MAQQIDTLAPTWSAVEELKQEDVNGSIDWNKFLEFLAMSGKFGETPLHYACCKNASLDVVQKLVMIWP